MYRLNRKGAMQALQPSTATHLDLRLTTPFLGGEGYLG